MPTSDDEVLFIVCWLLFECKLQLITLMIQAFHQALQISASPATCFCVQHFSECRLSDGCLVEGVHTWVMLCHQGFPSTLQLNHMLLSYTTLAWLVAIHSGCLLNKKFLMIIRKVSQPNQMF